MTQQPLRIALPLMALGALVTSGCGRLLAGPTPTPTALDVVVAALASDTPVPADTPTGVPPTPDFVLTAIAGATQLAQGTAAAGPTLAPVVVPGGSGLSSPGCEIPRQPDLWRLAPGPDAPAADQAAWASQSQPSLAAQVVEHRASEGQFVLRSADPATDYRWTLSYSGAHPPLEVGLVYRFTAWQDTPGSPPAGAGLKVEDGAGPVFLGVSLRETAGADGRVLNGDRAGFAVQQLPTQCLFTEVTPCGVELRASPLEVGRGGGKVTLGPGKSAELLAEPGQPRYRVHVATSHQRRPIAEAPCPDPTDWVLSYQIARLPDNP